LADTSGFPSTHILMAITHLAIIRTVTPILIHTHIRLTHMHIRTIPTPMTSPRSIVNQSNRIPGITVVIRKGITRM
jgi:hypothetical protein